MQTLDVSPLLPSLRAMQIKFSKSATAALAAVISTGADFAHPGHSTADPVAELSQPLAGADHFAAFVALTTILLLALRGLVNRRAAKMETERK